MKGDSAKKRIVISQKHGIKIGGKGENNFLKRGSPGMQVDATAKKSAEGRRARDRP